MEKTTLLNPEELIIHMFKFEGFEGSNFKLGHIYYDEKMDNDYDYQIIRQSSHDGTLIFRDQLIAKALKPLVYKETYCIKDITEEQLENVIDIEYTIGNVKLESKYGKVTVGIGGISGVTDTVSIPVRCQYTFKDENTIKY